MLHQDCGTDYQSTSDVPTTWTSLKHYLKQICCKRHFTNCTPAQITGCYHGCKVHVTITLMGGSCIVLYQMLHYYYYYYSQNFPNTGHHNFSQTPPRLILSNSRQPHQAIYFYGMSPKIHWALGQYEPPLLAQQCPKNLNLVLHTWKKGVSFISYCQLKQLMCFCFLPIRLFNIGRISCSKKLWLINVT